MLNHKIAKIFILFIVAIELISCFTVIENIQPTLLVPKDPKEKHVNEIIQHQSNQFSTSDDGRQLSTTTTTAAVIADDTIVAIDNKNIPRSQDLQTLLLETNRKNLPDFIIEYETTSSNHRRNDRNGGANSVGADNFIKYLNLNADKSATITENAHCQHPEEFNYFDYAVVIGMLVISLGIGVFYGFFQKSEATSDSFLLGSGMSLLPVTLSLTTSFITAIELLGNPAEMYYFGTQFSLIVIPMLLVIPVAIKIFYPIYFKLQLTSCYEYLGIRFGKELRIFGALLYIIQMNFYTAVAVLAPAIALSKATGINTRIAIVLIYIVCVFYSSQGGMKAVVIADTFQACVLALSLLLIVILGHYFTGGITDLIDASATNNRFEFFNFDPNPTTRHTVFSVVIGGFFYWTSLFCTNQASVQKCMSLKSLKLAKNALAMAICGLVIVFILNFYTGLLVFENYVGCDPLKSGRIDATDQLLPYYVMDSFESIVATTGLFVAGIFAASLGTVASALNSMAGVTVEDLLTNGLNMKIPVEKGAKYAKWISLGYGVFSFALIFVVERLGEVLQVTLTLNGLIGGVTLGLFVLGIGFRKANAKGAFYGGIAALIVVIYIGIMAQITNVKKEFLPLSVETCSCISGNNTAAAAATIIEVKHEESGFSFSSIYQISYMWYSMLGTLLTIIFGLIVSFVHDAILKYNVLKITRNKNCNGSNCDKDNLERSIKAISNCKDDKHSKVSEKCGIDNKIAIDLE